MKLEKITLCNFKNFKGEHTLNVSVSGNDKKNIILIGGINGSGKTTLLEAIRLCLYGKRMNGYLTSNKEYERYIRRMKNRKSLKSNDKDFYIKIDLKLDELVPSLNLTMKRSWDLNGKKVNEKFDLLRDNEPLEIIPPEYWEDYTLSLIPPHISEFFFFDGEKVKNLAVGDNADKILRESIRDIFGLNLYETLAHDLKALTGVIKKRNIKNKDIEIKLEEKENEIKTLEKRIKTLERKKKENVGNKFELYDNKIEIENKLRLKAGSVAKERDEIIVKLDDFKSEIGPINDEIRQMCGSILPLILASDLCDDLINQLETERKVKEVKFSTKLLKDLQKEFMKESKSIKNINQKIRKELDHTFSYVVKNMIMGVTNYRLIHDLSPSEASKVEDFLKKSRQSMKRQLKKSLKHREKINLEMKKLQENMKKVPSDSYIGDYIKKISSIDTKMELLERDNENIENEIKQLNIAIKTHYDEIDALQEKIICQKEDREKIDLCYKITKTVLKFNNAVIQSGLIDLENGVTEKYSELANKDDMVERIKINHSDFSTELIDFEGDSLTKEDISAGEKEIYALSILWGLANMSNKNLPMIIDSPLAKLDNGHVGNIIKKFFPQASDQVIILSHDREISEKEYNKIRRHVGREYRLTLNEVNKIKPGYFFK